MEFIKNEQVGQHLHVTVRDTDINKLNDHGVAQLRVRADVLHDRVVDRY